MNKFREALSLKKEFIVTCEFVPGRGYKEKSIEAIFEFASKVIAAKLPVHALSITDNPGGNPALSPDVIASELRSIGMDSIVHFSCSNLNRNMMESRAYALARGGQENIFVITGDYPTSGYEGLAKPVFDIDSVLLLKYLAEMNSGLRIPGRKPDTFDQLAPTNFFLGCGVSPFKQSPSEYILQLTKLIKKVGAGADFIISQLGYNVRKYAELMKYMKTNKIERPILGNVYILTKTVAQVMNKQLLPGCTVTDGLMAKIVEEYENPQKGKQAQLERSAQLYAILKGLGFSGVHIGGFGLKFEDVEALLARADQIGGNWRNFVDNFQYAEKNEFYFFPDQKDLLYSTKELEPRRIKWKRKNTLHYRFGHLIHKLIFTRTAIGYKIMRSFYRFADKRKNLMRVMYFLERLVKRSLFHCQECGDCALFHLAYICPMYGCAKTMRNGPCGGSRDRMCEADRDKRCYWTLVFDRLAGRKEIGDLATKVLLPINHSLNNTSSWANYFLGRDYNAKMDSVPPHN